MHKGQCRFFVKHKISDTQLFLLTHLQQDWGIGQKIHKFVSTSLKILTVEFKASAITLTEIFSITLTSRTLKSTVLYVYMNWDEFSLTSSREIQIQWQLLKRNKWKEKVIISKTFLGNLLQVTLLERGSQTRWPPEVPPNLCHSVIFVLKFSWLRVCRSHRWVLKYACF